MEVEDGDEGGVPPPKRTNTGSSDTVDRVSQLKTRIGA